MHRTLKSATARPAHANLRAQQRAFDAFRHEYNEERPHEALGNVPPVTLYSTSTRTFPGHVGSVTYPPAARLCKVISNGRIRWNGALLFLNSALTGDHVEQRSRDDGCTDFFFADVHLGCVDPRRPQLGLIRPNPTSRPKPYRRI